jgi:tetratricopeptide (TPR) repeat protein
MRVRLLAMQRRFEEAAQMASAQLARVATPALAVQAGDAMSALGRTADADRYYQQAEELWRYEPAALARFLADTGRDVTRAVKLAESASATRRDIFTQDALAWSLFKAGEIRKADVVLQQALRTGTRDRMIRAHAAEIRRALNARS